jgi:hypothetical protein
MRRTCSIPKCGRQAVSRGWCHGHYQRWVRLGDVMPLRPLGRRVNHVCRVAGCGRDAYARQLCKVHYRRQLATGDPQADKPVREVDGTGGLSHGYYKMPVPPELRHLVNGARSALQHRLVMAQMLGRPLYADESVHHKNGDRLDNCQRNLELWSRWQPRGQRAADKVQWAVEILQRYAPDQLGSSDPDGVRGHWTTMDPRTRQLGLPA